MMKTLKQYKEDFKIHRIFNVYKCDYCGEEMIGVIDEDFEIEIFEPKTVEKEYISTKDFKRHNMSVVESSDLNKDIISFKCPKCGHIHKMTRKVFFEKQRYVNVTGNADHIFVLNEIEAKAAEEFMKDHKNCCVEKLGKSCYSSTGGQYSYIITPTGLGNVVEIKCNACKDKKDITDSDKF